jgi:hypothetical protein
MDEISTAHVGRRAGLMSRRIAGTVLVALCLVTGAAATEIAVVPKKLIVVDKLAAAGKAKLVYVAKDQAAGITKGTGTDVGQIGVRFDVVYGNGSAAGSFTVPAGAGNGTDGWLVNKSAVAKYVNKSAPGGPTQAKVGVVKPGKLLKLVGKGLGDVPLDVLAGGDPGAGGVRTAYCVTNGAEEHCHCSDFTACTYKAIAGDSGAKLVCKTGTGDAACGAVPPPPTSTSTTTTTSTSTTFVSGCYVDTGLTVIDTCNGLEWEKKHGLDLVPGSGETNPDDPNDVDNPYTWAGRCTLNPSVFCQPNAAAAATCAAQTGGAFGCGECGVGDGVGDPAPIPPLLGAPALTTIWDWLNQMNGANYAGHADWRVPTMAGNSTSPTGEPPELESLLDPTHGLCAGLVGNCLDPILEPEVGISWSASTDSGAPEVAWNFWFFVGTLGGENKGESRLVRAVRSVP